MRERVERWISEEEHDRNEIRLRSDREKWMR